MQKPSIIFIPFHFRHWEMYLPLVPPLEKAGIDVRFAAINGFNYVAHNPGNNDLNGLKVQWLNLSTHYIPKNKIQFFWIIYKQLLPQWLNYLKTVDSGAVVSVDQGAIHRLMLNAAEKEGLKKVSLQDGHYVTLPLEFGSNLETIRRRTIKKMMLKTPFEKFMNREPGAASDYYGLYGKKNQERIREKHPRFKSQIKTEVVGCTRHAIFRKKFNKLAHKKVRNEFRILCLPTGFAPYHDQKLDESQDLALKWLLKSSIKLDSKNDSKVVINLKVKGGYGQYFDYYKNLLNHPSVRILDESASLIELLTETDLVITTGSTASLEAATCHLPVIQIAPPYLLKKIIFVSGLPLAKTCDELESLMEEAIINSQDFYRRRCCNVKEELADVDPAWDSIKKTSDWLISLVT